jgi:hypothetical protein
LAWYRKQYGAGCCIVCVVDMRQRAEVSIASERLKVEPVGRSQKARDPRCFPVRVVRH